MLRRGRLALESLDPTRQQAKPWHRRCTPSKPAQKPAGVQSITPPTADVMTSDSNPTPVWLPPATSSSQPNP